MVFSSQTHGKFTAFYRDAMGKGAPHAADSLAFQAGACPMKKLHTVLPVLQKMTDREQNRPKTLPVLHILTDREHRPRREGSLLKPGFIRRAGERAFKTKTADKAIADGFLCRDP